MKEPLSESVRSQIEARRAYFKTKEFKKQLQAEYDALKNLKIPSPSFGIEDYLVLTTAQSYGPCFERMIISHGGHTKVASSLDRGDYKTKDDLWIEYKFSYADKGSANFVQIRLWQKLDFYALEVYVPKEGLYSFLVPKDVIEELINETGAQLAHGCKSQ